MRLLNLWPNVAHRTRLGISPAARLIKEAILTGLLLLLAVSGAYVYLAWKTDNAKEVNLELEQNLARMQKEDVGLNVLYNNKAYLNLRAQHKGQLDWLIGLIQLTDRHVQLLHVTQKEGTFTIHGQTDSAASAQQAIERINQEFSSPDPILQQLESKVEQNLNRWLFTVQVNGQTPKVVQ